MIRRVTATQLSGVRVVHMFKEFVLASFEGTLLNNWFTMSLRKQEILSVGPPTQLIIGSI